jgi:hypothetical protein
MEHLYLDSVMKQYMVINKRDWIKGIIKINFIEIDCPFYLMNTYRKNFKSNSEQTIKFFKNKKSALKYVKFLEQLKHKMEEKK